MRAPACERSNQLGGRRMFNVLTPRIGLDTSGRTPLSTQASAVSERESLAHLALSFVRLSRQAS